LAHCGPQTLTISGPALPVSESSTTGGTFTISAAARPLSVGYTLGGTATFSADYTLVAGTGLALPSPVAASGVFTLSGSTASPTLRALPVLDADIFEGIEDAVVTLQQWAGVGNPYNVGSPSSATMVITNSVITVSQTIVTQQTTRRLWDRRKPESFPLPVARQTAGRYMALLMTPQARNAPSLCPCPCLPLPQASIAVDSPDRVSEGGSLSYTISLANKPTTGNVVVNFKSDITPSRGLPAAACTAPTDFTFQSPAAPGVCGADGSQRGSVTFTPAGAPNITFSVLAAANSPVEGPEVLGLSLLDSTSYGISTRTALGFVTDAPVSRTGLSGRHGVKSHAPAGPMRTQMRKQWRSPIGSSTADASAHRSHRGMLGRIARRCCPSWNKALPPRRSPSALPACQHSHKHHVSD
jgi:hypothetical protein